MEILDATIISPAIPEIARSFGTTPVAVSAGISSYLITVAIFIPASAWMSDRFGVRNVFACAIGVFTIASVLCGMAETLTQFTAARVLQGIGGAVVLPGARHRGGGPPPPPPPPRLDPLLPPPRPGA